MSAAWMAAGPAWSAAGGGDQGLAQVEFVTAVRRAWLCRTTAEGEAAGATVRTTADIAVAQWRVSRHNRETRHRRAHSDSARMA
ncbi:hypothetical protein Phou_022490 [Phytohabitans houttuyneae]|uniref:Uncharacterized protein n=1 Tax=Phytohabitans houttuyneae TaxID=1076126 RepID=A0A6V8K7H2_9ACTN|nr:hypothetical protein Phou_022490 [Phytohabitans houttuyneae]